MKESDSQRIRTIEALLESKDYAALERFVVAEVPRGLLGDEVLDAARRMNLVPAVIYLATLGAENLPAPNDRAPWLAVYQSIARGEETEEFRALAARLPVKWVARRLAAAQPKADEKLDVTGLARCESAKNDLRDWLAAFELAMDRGRFDLVEALVDRLCRCAPSLAEWVRIAQALGRRQPSLSEFNGATDVAPLARAYERIRAQLPEMPVVSDARSLLANLASRCFLQSGGYRESIELAEACTASRDRADRLAVTAEAWCHLGDLPKSIALLDEALDIWYDPQHVEEIREAHERAARDKKPQPHFDVDLASQALVDLQKVLDQRGLKFFLVSGTLLGYAREGRLLAHDKDIDVGIMDWKDQYDVAIALVESGVFWPRLRSIAGAGNYYLPIQHLPTGVGIDIFIYHARGDQQITAVHHFFGHTQEFAFSRFGLKAAEFLGTQVYVPDDVDTNLTENFGNWRAPDPDYLSHLESPSTVDAGGLAYQVTARLLAMKWLRDVQPGKLHRTLGVLRRYSERPCGIDMERWTRMRDAAEALDAAQPAEVAA